MANSIESVVGGLDIDTSSYIFSKERLVNEFARITQFLTWPVLAIAFNLFFKLEINGNEVFKNTRGPILIVANHTSFYDSFAFRLILGFRTDHLPLRFMAVNVFESEIMNIFARIGLIDFIYSLFGVFTITPGLGIEKNITKAKDIVFLGGNVVIYPEGRIEKTDQVGKFKNGASVLFKQTGVEVIPVSFRNVKSKGLRQRLIVNVGKPILISRKNTVENTTRVFRDKVLELFNSVSPE
jgi:1-acyl-sn-glycerol-3-phosphate acyltransferase